MNRTDQTSRPVNGPGIIKAPPGWQLYRLGDATKITSGITLGRNLHGRQCRLVPYLRVANVKDGFLDLSEVKQTPATQEEIDACRLEPGDVLLTEGGDLDKLGRGTFWEGQIPDCIHQNHIFRVRADPAAFDPAFLAFQFGSPYGKAYFLRHAKQTTGIASINKTVISNFPLLAPPFVEQNRISGRLSGSFHSLRLAMDATAVQIAEVSSLTTALVLQSLECAKKTKARLADALQEVKHGVGERWAEYPVLGATRAGVALAKERPGKHAERYKPVFPGTVFYNPMRITIGSIAFVDEEDEFGITSPDYVVLKCKAGVMDSRWFYYWLRSPLGERCIQSLARGAVRERMLFSRLASGEIELPDFGVQQRTSLALAQIRHLRAALKKQVEEFELIPQKLLAQFFRN
jgi:type I restriction enzyme, S subunit